MKHRTKIVCTLGPAVASREKVKDLIAAGMDVARLNCSHGDWESKREWISWIRETSNELSPVAILADLQGPKFRIGVLPGDVMEVRPGDQLTISQNQSTSLKIPASEIFQELAKGDRLLLGDGEVELKVGCKEGEVFGARAVTGGIIKSRQGVTLVGKTFEVPALTEKDVEDVFEACRAGADFIALSYVRQASDLRELRRLVDKYDPTIRLCAKIETRAALKDIDEIIKVCDLVMVARGDLGLQMDIEDVPLAQKKIIERCTAAGRPVITATQMLESMIHSPRPTRAEASDVANAILDGTDAIMLSGETAAGQYPIEAVRMMVRIAEKTESSRLAAEHAAHRTDLISHSTEAVAQAASRLADHLKVKAIVTTSTSGLTPRMVSKFRPRCPIYAATWNERTHAQMGVVWGVEALYIPLPANTDEIVENAVDAFLKHKKLKVGDTVVVTAGVPAGAPGNTNLILVHTVK